MHKKRLKAITVNGSKDIPLVSPEEFKELALSSSKILGKAMSMLTDQGTNMYFDIGMMFNDIPIKYFSSFWC